MNFCTFFVMVSLATQLMRAVQRQRISLDRWPAHGGLLTIQRTTAHGGLHSVYLQPLEHM